MEIRLLNANELRWAASTAMEVYTSCVLPYARTPEEIETFKRYVDENHLWVEFCKKKLYLWGAFENGEMCAVGGMEHTGRITMLYVKPAYQRGDCETELVRSMRQYAVRVLGLPENSVGVQLPHPVYQQQIYMQSQPYMPYQDGQKNGVKGPGYQEKKPSHLWIGLLIAGIICVAAVVGGMVVKTAVSSREAYLASVGSRTGMAAPSEDSYPNGAGVPEESDTKEGESVNGYHYLQDGLGCDFIVPSDDIYIAEGLEYTVSTRRIDIADNGWGNDFTEFDISYPEIAYADGRDASAVNQTLRDCACLWMDVMYPEPQTDELLYDEEYPYLASYVDYEITYMSNEVICVAFEDHYFEGTIYYECFDLRTRVINLSTGESYELEEIITHDTALDESYYEKLCDLNESFREALAFDSEKAGATLGGECPEGRFYSNFIVSKSGVKLNLTYHYGDEKRIMRGWESMGYSDEELAAYRTDSTFWELYQVE